MSSPILDPMSSLTITKYKMSSSEEEWAEMVKIMLCTCMYNGWRSNHGLYVFEAEIFFYD